MESNINRDMYKHTGIPCHVIEQIRKIAAERGASKVTLFGSRARGEQHLKSDIDLAIYGCKDFVQMSFDLDEKLWSLLELDVINMDDEYVSDELVKEIEKDGIVIYEKI